jgi:cytochrome P450
VTASKTIGDTDDDVLDLDAIAASFSADPHPLYASLRQFTPVRRVRVNGLSAWLVTGYDAVKQAMAHPGLSNDIRSASPAVATHPFVRSEAVIGLDRHMLRSDLPDHTRLRRLVAKPFTVRRIEALRPRVRQIADELLAKVLPAGKADLVHDYALQLPAIVIMELLGLPPADRGTFLHLLDGAVSAKPEQAAQALAAYVTVREYLAGQVARRSQEPPQDDLEGGDLLGALVAVRDEGDRLSQDELISMVFLLVSAGHVTTVDLIANGALALLRNPAQLAALRADRGLLSPAIEEFLRYDGPIECVIMRFTRGEPVTISGSTIPGGGEPVLLSVASTGRDPARFTDPEKFDISRPPSSHLAFGHGIHYCLGAPLARMEGQVAFSALLDHCDGLALAVDYDALPWRDSPYVRGPANLPVTFTPVPTPQPRSPAPS